MNPSPTPEPEPMDNPPLGPCCAVCKKAARHNVPRIGPAGGWVHEDGTHLCTASPATQQDAVGETPLTDAYQFPATWVPTRSWVYAEDCADVERQLAATRKELEEVRADTRRLDWLELLHVSVPTKFRPGKAPVYVQLNRAAIDAAASHELRAEREEIIRNTTQEFGEHGDTP